MEKNVSLKVRKTLRSSTHKEPLDAEKLKTSQSMLVALHKRTHRSSSVDASSSSSSLVAADTLLPEKLQPKKLVAFLQFYDIVVAFSAEKTAAIKADPLSFGPDLLNISCVRTCRISCQSEGIETENYPILYAELPADLTCEYTYDAWQKLTSSQKSQLYWKSAETARRLEIHRKKNLLEFS